ncbi:MAG: acetyl-CoA carboxylase biotin carboxyl carrier protein [Flavobacteriales bacterium]|nr:acetyl-CoA carboxylase biotin carboxyl carrier protein [Flavobacteriales bacterium]
MNIKEIQDLIKFVARQNVTEVEIEQKDFKLTIKSEDKKAEPKQILVQAPQAMPQAVAPAAPAPAPAAAPAPVAPEAPAADDSKYITVLSPMIGTFYRSPGPDKDNFVSVGDTVKPGDVLCIIEAMKLFNEIESEVSGKIVKVLVDDSTPVEYDQPLFLVDPS